MDERQGVSTGPNARTLSETMAETGPGIPDDAVLEGELAPGDIGPVDADAERLRATGWAAPANDGSDPGREAAAEAETEAHPT